MGKNLKRISKMQENQSPLKIIHISSVSASLFLNSGRGDIKKLTKENWHALTSVEIKKRYPRLDIECWSPEIRYKKEKGFSNLNLKFRIFPSNFVLRPGMELCFLMIKKLNEEIEKNQNKKIIIHLHEYHSWQVYLILYFLKKRENVRVVVQHHGGRSPIANLKKYKRLILFFPAIILMQFFENLLFKKVDIFYVLSENEIDYLEKIAPKSLIKFQSMGIGEEYFKIVNRKETRKKLGLDLNKKYVIFIGRIKATKGIKELLDASRKLKEIDFLILGRGEDFERYKEYMESKNIKNVKFLGPIYGDEKFDYLSASDCLILPSHTEGAPVVLMEAIAKNIPVISTNVGGIPKMIKNRREGIIIKPNSRKEIIKSIKEILKWKRKKIQKYAKKYKWSNIVKQTYEDYKKC